jgi:hypothetical protein
MWKKPGKGFLILVLISVLAASVQIGCQAPTPGTTESTPAVTVTTVSPTITTTAPGLSISAVPSATPSLATTPIATATVPATISPAVTPITPPITTSSPVLTQPAWTPPPVTSLRNTITFPAHTLTKNFWGAPPGETLSGDIFLNSDKSYGWWWDRENPLMKPGVPGVLPIYPNVNVGADFGVISNSALFPVLESDIKQLSFSVDYQYLNPPTGEYNFAYQMYFSDVKNPGLNTAAKAEVMIWIHCTFKQPPTTYRGDYNDGNNTYSLYSWTMSDGRQYYSFVMLGDPSFRAKHTVDANKLMNNFWLNPSWYLLGVHLGNEVLDGTGAVQIQQLAINLNGNKI